MTRPSRFGRLFDALLVVGVIMTVVRFYSSLAPGDGDTGAWDEGAELVLQQQMPFDGGWSKADVNVVLFASVSCPSIKRSFGLYQELMTVVETSAATRLVVVTTDRSEDLGQLLSDHHVRPTQFVRQDSLAIAGASVLPTLAIVDRAGRVSDIAVGMLSTEEQTNFVARVRRDRNVPPLNKTYAVPHLREADLTQRFADGDVTIVDPRELSEFEKGHIKGAEHIPFPELAKTARARLEPARAVVVDCRSTDKALCQASSHVLTDLGFKRLALLVSR